MATWVEKNRVYSNAGDPVYASVEIDTYAADNGLRLSVESQPRAEMRGTRQVYLKRVMGKKDDPLGPPAVKAFVGLRK